MVGRLPESFILMTDAAPPPTESSHLDPGRPLSGTEIARVAGILMFAFFLSGLLGLSRQIIVAAAFGADRDLDAFYAALRLPETLFALVAGGALSSAFIPVFARYLNEDSFAAAWKLVSAVLTVLVMVATGGAILAVIFAGPLVENLLIPSADTATQHLAVELMRIMLVTVVIFGVSGLCMAILNAHQSFITPALAPSMYNVGIIIGALVFAPSLGIHGLAWGVVIGAGLHLAVQIRSLLRLPHRRISFSLEIQTSGVTQVLALMGPRLLGLMVVQVNFWVNVALASAMTPGSLTALSTAFGLMFTVLGVLGQSLGTAVFPTLATYHAQGDMARFARTFRQVMGNVLFLSIPASMGMMLLSRPLVEILFQRGAWSVADTQATAWALVFYAAGLAGHAALEILARTFYALRDTWTPVRIGVAAMLLNIALSFALVGVFESVGADNFTRGAFGGLALANSLATALESTILFFILTRRLALGEVRAIMFTLGRTLVAAIFMVLVIGGWLIVTSSMAAIFVLAIGVPLGIAAFWAAAVLLHIEEATGVPRLILARFRR